MTMQDGSKEDYQEPEGDGRKPVVETGQPDRPKGGGYTRGPAVPSIHDIAMMDEGANEAAAWNLAKELITGSQLPEEYLPRGVYDHKTIARRKRLVSKYNRVYKRRGSCMNDSIWVGDQMGIALNGAGREDAKEVAKAAMASAREDRDRRGFMGMNRPRATNNG